MTTWVQDRANELLRGGNSGVKRVPFATAIKAGTTHQEDFVLPYVNDLANVIDMDAIRSAGLELGAGTENIYKIYAESFTDEAHLNRIVSEAQRIVNNALAGR